MIPGSGYRAAGASVATHASDCTSGQAARLLKNQEATTPLTQGETETRHWRAFVSDFAIAVQHSLNSFSEKFKRQDHLHLNRLSVTSSCPLALHLH
jgi:hypothetical protein